MASNDKGKSEEKQNPTPGKQKQRRKKGGKGAKAPVEKTLDQKADELSKANSKKKNRLVLETKLSSKDFLELSGRTKFNLVNGDKSNQHAREAVIRTLLVAHLMRKFHLDGTVPRDIQGKPRGFKLYLRGTAVQYPHFCRDVITLRDEGQALTHHWQDCNEGCDAAFSVDCVTHMTEQQIGELVDSVGVLHAVTHDYYHNASSQVYLGSSERGLCWYRSVPGHYDPQPDLFQEWMLSQTFKVNDTTYYTREAGPTFPNTTQVILQIGEALGEYDPVPPSRRLRVSMETFLQSEITVGLYMVKDYPNIISVTPQYIVDATASWFIDRRAVDIVSRFLFARPLTEGVEVSMCRKIRTQSFKVDEQSVNNMIRMFVQCRLARWKPGLFERLLGKWNPFQQPDIDKANSTVGVAPKKIVAPPSRLSMPSLRTVKFMLKALPFVLALYRLRKSKYLGWFHRQSAETEFRSLVGLPQPPSLLKSVVSTVSSLVTLKRKLLPMTLASFLGRHWVYLTAPFYEEFFKMASPAVMPLIVGMETAQFVHAVTVSGVVPGIPSIVGHGLVEYAATIFKMSEFQTFTSKDWYIEYFLRVAIHLAWNMAAARHVDNMCPPPKRLPGYQCSNDFKPLHPEAKLKITDAAGLEVDYRAGELFDITKDDTKLFQNCMVLKQYQPSVQQSTAHNLAVGLVNRCLFNPAIICDPGRPTSAMIDFQELLMERLEDVKWYSYEEWNGRYDKRRRDQNDSAMRDWMNGSAIDPTISPFLKDELNHSTMESHKDPRVICGPRSCVTKILEGPYTYSIMKALRAQVLNGRSFIRQENGIEVTQRYLYYSGLDEENPTMSQVEVMNDFVADAAQETGHAMAVAACGDDGVMILSHPDWDGPYYITADAHRWDAHVDQEFLEAEDRISETIALNFGYEGTYLNDREAIPYCELSDIKHSLKQSVTPPFFVVCQGYTFRGKFRPQRFSGQSKTAGDNSVVNSSIQRRIGLFFVQAGIKPTEEKVAEMWRSYGFKCDVRVTQNMYEIDFCSMDLVPTARGPKFIPKLGRFLARTGLSIGKPRSKDELAAIFSQLVPLHGLPIMGPYIIKAMGHFPMREGAEVPRDKLYSPYMSGAAQTIEPNQETIEWYCTKYCITEDDIEENSRRILTAPISGELDLIGWEHFLSDLGINSLGLTSVPGPISPLPMTLVVPEELRFIMSIIRTFLREGEMGEARHVLTVALRIYNQFADMLLEAFPDISPRPMAVAEPLPDHLQHQMRVIAALLSRGRTHSAQLAFTAALRIHRAFSRLLIQAFPTLRPMTLAAVLTPKKIMSFFCHVKDCVQTTISSYTKEKMPQGTKSKTRVANVATRTFQELKAHVQGARPDNLVQAYSAAVAKPWRGKGAKIPLAVDQMPCKSVAVTCTGVRQHTMVNYENLGIYLHPEGVPGSIAGGAETADDKFVCPVIVDTATTPNRFLLGCPPTTVTNACAGWFAETSLVEPRLVSPASPAEDHVLAYDRMQNPIPPRSNAQSSQAVEVRLVSFGLRVSSSGRQSQIEGIARGICPYEKTIKQVNYTTPSYTTGGDFRGDDSYRSKAFDADRSITFKFWPNCETIMYRQVMNDDSSPLTVANGFPARMFVWLNGLAPGDKLTLEYIANYEVVTPLWTNIWTPSPVTESPATLANAIMTAAGKNEPIALHHIAHKVAHHPALASTKLGLHARTLLKAGIGGYMATQVAPKLVGEAKAALGRVFGGMKLGGKLEPLLAEGAEVAEGLPFIV